MDDSDGLDGFLPAVSGWFRETFGEPTPPQRQGWPAIASGQNTLIFAPTGSGKTLAAFLACLDHLWRTPRTAKGVRILYVSPLKALNQDVERNLRVPLEGILAWASRHGLTMEPLTVAVRSGDTPQAERQRIVRRPPDILITTPESLHLMLTSRARDALRTVSHTIVDEIHALAPNKRGVFLAILLERLDAIASDFVRIGLSATQRPLEEVARYLGGLRKVADTGLTARYEARPVAIVDAGRRKDLDLEVSFPSRSAGPQPSASIWPAIEQRLLELIRGHRSTIVFANNRRVAERLTAHLNELADAEPGSPIAKPDAPAGPIARSHHGSLSPEARRQTEELLKDGNLPAVVATASLELGIDMGAVDLVCQVESPGGIARGLQRVGRAGHLVGRTSKGRMLAKTSGDLVETAALARAMLDGQVEALRVPSNCLDVLTQQIIACVAVDKWEVPALFDLMRRAYPYRDLTPSAFESTLRLASGRFRVEALRDLKPRISWDRVHNVLRPLPGTKQLAVVGGGAIPDTGQYPLYLGEGGPRLGELDEEFVLERRVGETFVLGTSTWRITAIEPQKVVVAPAEGRSAMMPFWRGEGAGRTAELGAAVGVMCRQIAERREDPDVLPWLIDHYHLDDEAARSLLGVISRQIRQAGAVPDDRTVLVETFTDPSGETGLAVLTPFGHKLHHALKLVLGATLRARLGIEVAALHADDGVLFRLPGMDDPPLDVFRGVTSDAAFDLIRSELADSALFGLRFRQNAGRALLMPRPDPGKRTPLWLQRLRAKDLLQAVRKFPDFPIVIETYRECLDEDLDLPRLREFLDGVESGAIRVASRSGEIPSPFTSELIFRFTLKYLYEWDEPVRAAPDRNGSLVNDADLDPVLNPSSRRLWLDPDAVGRVEGRLRGVGRPPRSVDEMAEWLREVGDLAPGELAGPMLGFVETLRSEKRSALIELPGTTEPLRWIGAEEQTAYEHAFSVVSGSAEFARGRDGALADIVRRYLRTRALVDLDDLTSRYPIDSATACDLLESLADEGGIVPLGPDDAGREQWADARNLDEVRRISIAIKRREAVAVSPEAFAAFVARRQHVHRDTKLQGEAAVSLILEHLQGYSATAEIWEKEILPRRVADFRPSWLDASLTSGVWRWRAEGEGRGEPALAIVPRDFAGRWPVVNRDGPLSETEAAALAHLRNRGAAFVIEIARLLGEPPSSVHEALRGLLRRGLVANDRLDPLRVGGDATATALARASGVPTSSPRGRPRLGGFRRPLSDKAEGRWSEIVDPGADDETSLLAWSSALLDRYGVLARETAALDPWAPPWRELQPILARSELRGELRRGYFVEGLSGVQYALAETADALGRAPVEDREPVLLNTLDPANLYGSGAPFDVPLLEGGTARLPRSATNYIIAIAGRPVLICEGLGKRLTGLSSASEAEIRAAMALLPSLAGPSRRVLKVESYNTAAPLASPAEPWLAEVGFVRDPPGMAYYAGW
ncbi:MAG: Lhr-like helicase [Planctomycetota bacterium]|nr:Lhr-like helicase [Planctomycetota bacterium]